MKVCILTGIFPPEIGGPAVYVERLAGEFSKRGVGVKVITYADKVGQQDFKVVRVSKIYPKFLRHLLFLFKALIHSRDDDVIYAQNLFSVGIPGLVVSKILRKKLVVKIVGDYAWEQSLMRGWFSGGIDEFQRAKSLKINFLKRLQKALASSANTIITPSRYLKNIICGWGVSEDKIKVIYNAVGDVSDLDISQKEAQEKIGVRGDIILSIGRLAPWKGFSSLVEIMGDLVKENSNFKLLIVGEGVERENLELQIKNLGLKDKVRLAGRIAHEKLPWYFKAADLFVLNTGYEGFPHVILEAMQAKIPVITTKKGGNPEVIEDGVDGILVEYDKKEELKEAILRLWQDKHLREVFIKNSKEKLKEFSWEILVEKTLNVLKSA